jgi:rod shape-determining protein MreB
LAFNPLNWLLGFFSLDIGIDLGTANTLVNVRGKGIVINEPSWVAIDKRTRIPLAIGAEAKEMMGRTPPNVIAIRHLRDGVISEFEITQAMLEYFIEKAHRQSVVPVPRPRVVVGIPSGATEVEKRAVYDATMSAGAREAGLIEEPMAAALGAGLPVSEIRGSMIVDIGGGTSEVAVISIGGIVISRSLRVAGDEMDQDIVQYMRNKYNCSLVSGLLTKIAIGLLTSTQKAVIMRGRNLSGTGKRGYHQLIREAIAVSVNTIIDTVKDAWMRPRPRSSQIYGVGVSLEAGCCRMDRRLVKNWYSRR